MMLTAIDTIIDMIVDTIEDMITTIIMIGDMTEITMTE